jgi:addiction module RelE/StbE family toxin
VRIVWTRHYLIELASIGDYIGQHNPRAAARVVNEIHSKTARLLSANPFIGRVGEIKGTRELVIPGTPHIVAYQSEGNSDRNPFRPARRAKMAGRGLSLRS